MGFGSVCLTLVLSVTVLLAQAQLQAGELPGATLDAFHEEEAPAADKAPAAEQKCRKKRHKTNTRAKC